MSQFTEFGPLGPVFDLAWRARNEVLKHLWSQHPVSQTHPDHHAAVAKGMDQSALWLFGFLSLSQNFHVNLERTRQAWDRFKLMFTPRLGDWDATRNDASLRDIRSAVSRVIYVQLYAREYMAGIRQVTDPICFGPYSSDQLLYLKLYSRIRELGCGSGYLVSVMRNLGIDATGIDTNAYTFRVDGAESSEGIMDISPWSVELARQGKLLKGSFERLAELGSDGALLMSYPQPGSRFPLEALRACRAQGIRNFLFKPGGFIGVTTGGGEDMAAVGANCIEFFEELTQHWTAADVAPPFDPTLLNNNLFAFKANF